jgi:hypothetical protein
MCALTMAILVTLCWYCHNHGDMTAVFVTHTVLAACRHKGPSISGWNSTTTDYCLSESGPRLIALSRAKAGP